VHFTLDGSGPVDLVPPSLDDWPEITRTASASTRRVQLDDIDPTVELDWQPGDTLLISGKLLTGRDAAHKRIIDYLQRGEPLPNGLDFRGRFLYYVGPVDPVGDEVVGPAGPTTATRMDKFTDELLEKTGLLGMIGKAERGPEAIASIARHKAVYLIATGGAAYLVSRAIRAARVIAFAELGMEAVYEFEVEDMPVTVAVDTRGNSIHEIGPREWKMRIADIPVVTRQRDTP
jgi:fumarate hydratase class I